MKILKLTALAVATLLVLSIVALNIWGIATLGTITPDREAYVNPDANRVVLVMGATGSAGDGLLKAALEDRSVEKVYVLTRRSSPRIDAGVASGKLESRLHKDFTDYSMHRDFLGEVNTVLWGLGTSSLKVDQSTYTLIHVDFPMAFLREWLAARNEGPMAFHFITGMGTDGDAQWARDKSRTEREMKQLAQDTPLRTFSYRSGFIRPTSERAGTMDYIVEWLGKPGNLGIPGIDLGGAMLEISARTGELPNGTIVDHLDSIAYAELYRERMGL